MVKSFWTITVMDEDSDIILFTAYRREYKNAKDVAKKVRKKLESDGWDCFSSDSHYYLGDGGDYSLFEKEFDCISLNIDNDMAQLQDCKDGRLVLMLGDGTNKYFSDESECAIWMADVEHNSQMKI